MSDLYVKATPPCEDAEYRLLNTVPELLLAGSIPTGESQDITAPNSNIQINALSSGGTPQSSINPIPSGRTRELNLINTLGNLVRRIVDFSVTPWIQEIQDSVISVNKNEIKSLPATATYNISVVDSNGDAVATTIEGDNVLVDDLPCATPADKWTRPVDWLDMPTVAPTDDTFVALHAVFPSGQNFVAFRFSTDSGDYQVDWGDGTVTTHASNVVAEHEYDYATYDTSNSTLSSRGYKQSIITVTPLTGELRTANFDLRFTTTPAQNQPYATGFLDCILSMPNCQSGFIPINLSHSNQIRHRYIERFRLINSGNANDERNLFQNCSSLVVAEVDCTNFTIMSFMFVNCSALQTVELLNTSNVTDMNSTFFGCSSLQSVPLLDTSSVTSMSSMFNGCFSLQSVPLLDTSSVTTMSNAFLNCNSLDRTDIVCPVTVSFQNNQFSQSELVNIFNNLVDRSATTEANINISGNWGASALTTAERDIALNKNWTITG